MADVRRRAEFAVRRAVERPDEFRRQQELYLDVDAKVDRFRQLDRQLDEALGEFDDVPPAA
jgi:hypothetical protein